MQLLSLRHMPIMLVIASVSTGAAASGFQIFEQNASGLGTAYAGSAAVAEDASTIFFNPAGMTRLQEREYSVGIAAIKPSLKFSNSGSTSGALAGDGGNAGRLAYVPNAYAAWAVGSDLHFGIGLGVPFGLMTRYDNAWVGAAQSVKFAIKTYNLNPSVGYRVNDAVSIGGGLNWQYMDIEYVKRAAASPLAPLATLRSDDAAWGWNLGALFTLSPATRVGVSYRSEVEHTLKGPLSVPGLGSLPTSEKVTLPDVLIVSVAHQLDDDWQLLGDVSRTGWSRIHQLDITSGGVKLQTLDTEFKDAWRLALGANYRLNDAWRLKLGIAYDQTPVRDAARRLVALPDNDRTWISAGVQWLPGNGARVDVGLACLIVGNSPINSASPATGTTVRGTYDNSLWIFGAQYSAAY